MYDEYDEFKVSVFGGVFTGCEAEGVRVQALGDCVKDWCEKFHWPRSRRWSYKTFTEEHCSLFAQEFARKGLFHFQQWFHSDSPSDFVYTDEHVEEYAEGHAFKDFMFTEDFRSRSYAAGVVIRRLRPLEIL
jgi:hypothetical protein